jgi:hypothetical protein
MAGTEKYCCLILNAFQKISGIGRARGRAT